MKKVISSRKILIVISLLVFLAGGISYAYVSNLNDEKSKTELNGEEEPSVHGPEEAVNTNAGSFTPGEGCITFESDKPFNIGFEEDNFDGQMEYSLGADNSYKLYEQTDELTPSKKYNDKYYYSIRGKNNTFIFSTFVIEGSDVKCYGNIENLVDYTKVKSHNHSQYMQAGDYEADKAFHPEITDSCFIGLFENCEALIKTPDLSLIPEIPSGGFTRMFSGCTNLVEVSDITAKSAKSYAMQGMFAGCTSLESAPELKQTDVGDAVYAYMFQDCTNLKYAPKELSATTLYTRSYCEMFSNCISLETIPIIKAKNLGYESCYGMFDGCSAITDISKSEFSPQSLGQYSCKSMFSSCLKITTPVTLPATGLSNGCYEAMFRNCSNLTKTPALPATDIPSRAYFSMFRGCSSLNTIQTISAKKVNMQAMTYMFDSCKALINPPQLAVESIDTSSLANMFSGCINLNSTPNITFSSVSNNSLQSMFEGCSNLTTINIKLTASTVYQNSFKAMFKNCISLTSTPALPATTLNNNCYEEMFSGCISLTSAPSLPASTLSNYCYSKMFYNCYKLASLPSLKATNIPNYAYSEMFAMTGYYIKKTKTDAASDEKYIGEYQIASSSLTLTSTAAKDMFGSDNITIDNTQYKYYLYKKNNKTIIYEAEDIILDADVNGVKPNIMVTSPGEGEYRIEYSWRKESGYQSPESFGKIHSTGKNKIYFKIYSQGDYKEGYFYVIVNKRKITEDLYDIEKSIGYDGLYHKPSIIFSDKYVLTENEYIKYYIVKGSENLKDDANTDDFKEKTLTKYNYINGSQGTSGATSSKALIDNNTSTNWELKSSMGFVEFSIDSPMTITKLKLSAASNATVNKGRTPSKFILSAKLNESEDWTTIYNQTGRASIMDKNLDETSYYIENLSKFKYFKFEYLQIDDSDTFSLSDLKLVGYDFDIVDSIEMQKDYGKYSFYYFISDTGMMKGYENSDVTRCDWEIVKGRIPSNYKPFDNFIGGKTYDGTKFVPNITIKKLYKDTIKPDIYFGTDPNDKSSFSKTFPEYIDAGMYTVYYYLKDPTNTYDDSDIRGCAFNINKAKIPSSYKPTITETEKIYTGTVQNAKFEVPKLPDGETPNILFSEVKLGTKSTFKTSLQNVINARTYKLYYMFSATKNYFESDYKNPFEYEFTITKENITEDIGSEITASKNKNTKIDVDDKIQTVSNQKHSILYCNSNENGYYNEEEGSSKPPVYNDPGVYYCMLVISAPNHNTINKLIKITILEKVYNSYFYNYEYEQVDELSLDGDEDGYPEELPNLDESIKDYMFVGWIGDRDELFDGDVSFFPLYVRKSTSYVSKNPNVIIPSNYSDSRKLILKHREKGTNGEYIDGLPDKDGEYDIMIVGIEDEVLNIVGENNIVSLELHTSIIHTANDFTHKYNGRSAGTPVKVTYPPYGYHIQYSEEEEGTYTNVMPQYREISGDVKHRVYYKIKTPYYNLEEVRGSFEFNIIKGDITDDIAPNIPTTSFTYSGKELGHTLSTVNLTLNDKKTVPLVYYGKTEDATKMSTTPCKEIESGTYKFYYMLKDPAGNYNDSSVREYTVNIKKARPKLKDVAEVTNNFQIYDGNEKSATLTAPILGGDRPQILYSEVKNGEFSSEPTKISQPGTYTLYYKYAESKNYTASTNVYSYTLDISRPNIESSMYSIEDTYAEYDNEYKSPKFKFEQVANSNFKVEYYLDDTYTQTTTEPMYKEIGTYNIYYKIIDTKNIYNEYKGFLIFTISGDKKVRYRISDTVFTYDATYKSPNIEVTKPKTKYEITYKTEEEGSYTSEPPKFINAGEYKVYYKITADGFDEEEGSVDIVINKANITDEMINISNKTVTCNNEMQSIDISANLLKDTDKAVITYYEDSAMTKQIDKPGYINPGVYDIYFKVQSENYNDYIKDTVFTIERVKYNLSFSDFDGNEIEDFKQLKIDTLDTIIYPKAPDKSGYKFIGWAGDASKVLTENVTLESIYIRSKISKKADGQYVTLDTNYKEPENLITQYKLASGEGEYIDNLPKDIGNYVLKVVGIKGEAFVAYKGVVIEDDTIKKGSDIVFKANNGVTKKDGTSITIAGVLYDVADPEKTNTGSSNGMYLIARYLTPYGMPPVVKQGVTYDTKGNRADGRLANDYQGSNLQNVIKNDFESNYKDKYGKYILPTSKVDSVFTSTKSKSLGSNAFVYHMNTNPDVGATLDGDYIFAPSAEEVNKYLTYDSKSLITKYAQNDSNTKNYWYRSPYVGTSSGEKTFGYANVNKFHWQTSPQGQYSRRTLLCMNVNLDEAYLKETATNTYTLLSEEEVSGLYGEAHIDIEINELKVIEGNFDDIETTYNGEEVEGKVEVTVPEEGYNIKYSLDGNNYTETVPTFKNAGEYTVYYEIEVSDEYEIKTGSFAVKIAKANMLKPEVPESTFTYDAENKSVIVTPQSLIGDKKAKVYYSMNEKDYDLETPPVIKNASSSGTVYYKIVDEEGNYNDFIGSYDLIINKATITSDMINTDNNEVGVTGSELSPDITATLLAGDEAEINYYKSDKYDEKIEKPKYKEVGSYKIYYEVKDKNDNYEPYRGTLDFIICEKEIMCSVTEDEFDYDGTVKMQTVEVTDPENGAVITYSTDENGEYSEAFPEIKNAGEHTVYYKVSAKGYATKKGSFVVRINKIDMDYPNISETTFTYDGKEKSAVITPPELLGDSSGNAVVYYSLGTTSYDETTPPVIKNVSESETVYFKIVDEKGNYNDFTGSYDLKINKATIAAENISITNLEIFTGDELSPDIAATLPTEDEVEIKYYSSDEYNEEISKPKYTEVGTYTIYYEVKDKNDNYTPYRGSFDFTIEEDSQLDVKFNNYYGLNVDSLNVTLSKSMLKKYNYPNIDEYLGYTFVGWIENKDESTTENKVYDSIFIKKKNLRATGSSVVLRTNYIDSSKFVLKYSTKDSPDNYVDGIPNADGTYNMKLVSIEGEEFIPYNNGVFDFTLETREINSQEYKSGDKIKIGDKIFIIDNQKFTSDGKDGVLVVMKDTRNVNIKSMEYDGNYIASKMRKDSIDYFEELYSNNTSYLDYIIPTSRKDATFGFSSLDWFGGDMKGDFMFLPSISYIAYNLSRIKKVTDNWFILKDKTTNSRFLRLAQGDKPALSSSANKQNADYVWLMNLDLSYANMQKNSDGVWEIIQD